jgi:hypothetical protein
MLSYHNVKKAMDYYVSKGGTAKFIICDDGFQVGNPADEMQQCLGMSFVLISAYTVMHALGGTVRRGGTPDAGRLRPVWGQAPPTIFAVFAHTV